MSEQKIGRPEKIKGGGKCMLVIRVSKIQLQKIEDAAKSKGLAKSEWAREILNKAVR